MGKGSNDTQSTTQTTEYDPEVMKRMGAGYNAVAGMVAPFLKVPTNTVAGFTPDQTQAFRLARDLAQGAFTGSPVRAIPANAAQAAAAQVTGSDTTSRMNPYLETVGKTTLDNMRREYGNTDAMIGAKYGSGQAFGGSGEAIARGQAARGYNQDVASTISNIQAQAYESAAARAEADAARRQQASLTNAGATNDFALRAPTTEDGLANNDQQRKVAALQLLLGIGGTQQQLAQSSLDQPWTALQRLLAVTPQVSPSTTTQVAPDNSPGIGQQLLGAATTLGAAYLSDRETKTNIQKLGKDPATGQTLYAYDYKSDVEAAKREGSPMGPKRVGPMAQDHAKAGGKTQRIGGHLTMLLGD